MNIVQKVKFYSKEPRELAKQLFRRYGGFLCDKWFVKIQYHLWMGKRLNLKHPETFNEKLNWLKLYDHNPLYTKLVDKYAVKAWVADKIGEQYIIPTLGVWDRPEDIEWDKLPDQFVLKTTHGGGGDGIVICKDKNTFDRAKAVAKLKVAMNTDPYKRLREWPYKNVPRRIIAEQYMEDEKTQELRDYKFFGFDGVCKALFIATERQKAGEEVKFDYFDAQFRHLDLVQHHPMSGQDIAKPECFEEMKMLTEKITKGMPEARCDFYEVNGKAYFGEITFFHHGGVTPFHPDTWDKTWGEWIELPDENGWGKLLIYNNIVLYIHYSVPSVLKDYKFFCFNGKVQFFKIDYDRFVKHHANYYDREGRLQEYEEVACPNDKKASIDIPDNIQDMISIAESLSTSLPFVRVDLYNPGHRIYFGETTFYPAGGVGRLSPEGTDSKWGSYLTLPTKFN